MSTTKGPSTQPSSTPDLKIEKRHRWKWQERVQIGYSVLMPILFLWGTLLPGFALAGLPLTPWMALIMPPAIYSFAWLYLRYDTRARSRELYGRWVDENPHLNLRLKEVLVQAAKDPEGIGIFTQCLNLIMKDPDRALILEGLYYHTNNKEQLRLALCRVRFDGMSPDATWIFDSRIALAHYINLRQLFLVIYITSTAIYLALALVFAHQAQTGAYFPPRMLSTFKWLIPMAFPAIIKGIKLLQALHSLKKDRQSKYQLDPNSTLS